MTSDGNPVPDPLSPEQSVFRSKAMFVDFVFERLFRVRQFKMEGVPEDKHRRCLGVVKSLLYSLNNLMSLYDAPTGLGHEISNFSRLLDESRSRYLGLPALKQRTDLVAEVVAGADDLGNKVLAFLFKHSAEPFGTISRAMSEVSGPVRFSYPDGMRFVYTTCLSDWHDEEIMIPLPYIVHPLIYSEAPERLSQKLRSSLSLSEQESLRLSGMLEKSDMIVAGYFDFLRMRISYANHWHNFLSLREIPFGLFKFGWYL